MTDKLPLKERVRIFNLGTPTERHRDTYELVNDLWEELQKLSVRHVALAAEQKREGGSSTAAHTPGPWRTFDGNPSKIEIICGDRWAPNRWPSAGVRVAEIRFKRLGRGGAFNGNAADAANARLIAAAPDMLAALIEARAILTVHGIKREDAEASKAEGARLWLAFMKRIDDAIAKAVADRPANAASSDTR